VTGCCEYGSESLSSIKCGEFVEWLRNCSRSENDAAPRMYVFIYLVNYSVCDWCLELLTRIQE
jgi:hypothetical protein